MKTYQPGLETDILLLNWYFEMASGPDFEAVFSAELAPCGAFFDAMRRTILVYETDEKGIWFAAWFDRIMCAGAYGVWVRADRRDQPDGGETLRAGRESLRFGLEHFPVLLFVTRDPVITELASRFGFVSMGEVPRLFDGQSAAVAWLDAARFNAHNPEPHVTAFATE